MNLRILLFICIAALLPLNASAQPRATAFDIGVQGGISDWSLKASDLEDNYTGSSVGGVVRYTVWPGQSGVFVGLHAAFMSQQGEYKYEEEFLGSLFKLEEKIRWSTDFLMRAGYGSDRVAVYTGGGLSAARGRIRVEEESVGTAEDGHWHMGWKAMTGLDYSLSDNAVFNVQVEYAKYRSRLYNLDMAQLDSGETVDITDFGLSDNAKADALTARVGLLYRF